MQRDQENIVVVKQMPRVGTQLILLNFTRKQEWVQNVKIYLQVEAAKQPTIAIIVGQYYEKTAVDAMMTNRQTFVRYATVGKSEKLDLNLFPVSFFFVFVH